MPDLNIAEILYETGETQFRYTRYLSSDGTRWIRHGLFEAYHLNGALASRGSYADGLEQGLWSDYHSNGQLAAEGNYERGIEFGEWNFWKEDGSPEITEKE